MASYWRPEKLQAATQATKVFNPQCPLPRINRPRTSLFCIGIGGRNVLSQLRIANSPRVRVLKVQEKTNFDQHRDSHIAIILVGEEHTKAELQLANDTAKRFWSTEIVNKRASDNRMVVVIAGHQFQECLDQRRFSPSLLNFTWINIVGNKGVASSVSAILSCLYEPGFIAYDFADLQLILGEGGIGQAATIDIPFAAAKRQISYPAEFSKIESLLRNSSRALSIVTTHPDTTLMQLDNIFQSCRDCCSTLDEPNLVFTANFCADFVTPKLSVFAL